MESRQIVCNGVLNSHVCSCMFMCAGFGILVAIHENALGESSSSEIFVGYLSEAGYLKLSIG